MKIKNTCLILCASLAFTGFLSTAEKAQDHTSPLDLLKTHIKIIPLGNRVIVLSGNLLPAGGFTAAIKSEKGLVVIDTGGSPGIASLMKEMIQREFGAENFVYVIHTHGHADHVNGNQVYPEVQIVAHENSIRSFIRYSKPEFLEQWAEDCRREANNYRKRMETLNADSDDYELTERRAAIVEQIVIDIENGMKAQIPDITFNDSLTLDLGDMTLNMYYFENYHSDSDILIHIPEEGILFLGDTLSRSVLPGTNSYLSSVDITGWLNVLDKVLEDGIGINHAVRGHSYIMTGEEIKARRDYLKHVWSAVSKANSEGMSPENILTQLPLDKFEYLTEQYERDEMELAGHHKRIVTGLWRQLQDKGFATEIIEDVYIDKGLDAAVEKYMNLIEKKEKLYFDEDIINYLAYKLLFEGESDKAIKLLKIHVNMFPESFRAFSFLGDAFLASGSKTEAVKAYTKALSLNPNDPETQDKLKKAKNTLKDGRDR